MSPMFKTRRMEAGVVLRAAAISLVALNHANPDIDQVLGFNFSGGMSVLMALSGYFFAKFVLDAPSLPQIDRLRAIHPATQLLHGLILLHHLT